jgi:heterodisulfide reductase subunit D
MTDAIIQEAYGCLDCGKCSGICPVARYAKTFSPRRLLSSLVVDGNSSEDYWSCLTCMQCETICPSEIQYSALIQKVRELKGDERPKDRCSHGGVFDSIMRIMSANNLEQKRMDWLKNKNQISSKSEYLYFVGCLPYFEQMFANSITIANSTLKILNFFDVRPQMLANEKCCGHDALWMGDRATFMRLAKNNLDQLTASGARTIITACPECYRTLHLDYTAYFGKQPFEVVHISEFFQRQMAETKHKIKPRDAIPVTYQDPCRLGRHLGIYEEPRMILRDLLQLPYAEMAHHHSRAICCGVSNWSNCSQMTKEIQLQRLNEARQSGAELLVTACPKCKIHFECAQKNMQLEQEKYLEIKDITEVIANHLH